MSYQFFYGRVLFAFALFIKAAKVWHTK